jgi:hypothetical protein
MTTFFVEFEMANVFDFSVIGATRSLLITHWIGDYTNEGEYAVEYVNFSRPTLPIEVVSDFDYKTKLNGKKTAKNITAQFIATEWA